MALSLTLSRDRRGGVPEPQDVLIRRVFAYFIDFWVIVLLLAAIWLFALLATMATLGLFAPLFLLVSSPVVALPYHILQLSGRQAATLGMRIMGLQASAGDGGRPSLVQATVHTVGFYATLAVSGGILLLFALFHPERRTLHDLLADIVIHSV